MKNLGRIDLLPPLRTTKEVRKLYRRIKDENQFCFEFGVNLDELVETVDNEAGMGAPISGVISLAEDKFYEYVNAKVEGLLSDMGFEFRKSDTNGIAVIRVTASPDELDWPDDVDEDKIEQLRRDKKNGLYGQKEQDAN